MKQNCDVIFGSVLAFASYLAAHVSEFIGVTTAIFILGIMILRFRKEWRHRDD